MPIMTVTFSQLSGGARAMVAGLVLLGALTNVVTVHAAEPAAAGDHGKAVTQQQRRAALRAALQAQREAEAPKADHTVRQLTPAERAKLRDQLRQQRRDGPPGRNG